jgi:hypothetical protein
VAKNASNDRAGAGSMINRSPSLRVTASSPAVRIPEGCAQPGCGGLPASTLGRQRCRPSSHHCPALTAAVSVASSSDAWIGSFRTITM